MGYILVIRGVLAGESSSQHDLFQQTAKHETFIRKVPSPPLPTQKEYMYVLYHIGKFYSLYCVFLLEGGVQTSRSLPSL